MYLILIFMYTACALAARGRPLLVQLAKGLLALAAASIPFPTDAR